jgi:hypothetical protein
MPSSEEDYYSDSDSQDYESEEDDQLTRKIFGKNDF